MNKLTQVQKIVEFADNNGTFTMREIYEKCYINSPTARMSDMRKMGYVFEQSKIETEEAWYFQYKIIDRPKEGENKKASTSFMGYDPVAEFEDLMNKTFKRGTNENIKNED